MELKKVKKVIFEVDLDDFEEYVSSIYGGNPEIIANEELNNNSYFEFTIPEKWYQPDEDVMAEIRSGEYPMYSFYAIVRCLQEDGHLEDGEYIITASW